MVKLIIVVVLDFHLLFFAAVLNLFHHQYKGYWSSHFFCKLFVFCVRFKQFKRAVICHVKIISSKSHDTLYYLKQMQWHMPSKIAVISTKVD